MFLLELTEEEATEVEMLAEDTPNEITDYPLEITRPEGAGGKPRVWVTGVAELISIVETLSGEEEDPTKIDPAILAAIEEDEEATNA